MKKLGNRNTKLRLIYMLINCYCRCCLNYQYYGRWHKFPGLGHRIQESLRASPDENRVHIVRRELGKVFDDKLEKYKANAAVATTFTQRHPRQHQVHSRRNAIDTAAIELVSSNSVHTY